MQTHSLDVLALVYFIAIEEAPGMQPTPRQCWQLIGPDFVADLGDDIIETSNIDITKSTISSV